MLKSLVNLLFPKTCCGCNVALLQAENTVCTRCRHDMPFTQHYKNVNNEVYNRFQGRLLLEHASSAVYFHKKGMVQQMVHNLKYKGQQQVGTLIGQLYGNDLKYVESLQTITEIIPVPLHPKKLRERGYNQVTTFGRELATALNVPYNETILLRKTYTKTQTNKNLAARAEIIGSAFDVKYTQKDIGKHFLLIDDVVTTGATLEACGRALLQIPNSKLSIVTIAYAHT